MTDQKSNKQRTNIYIHPKDRERWEEQGAKHGYHSLTSWIEFAMNNFIPMKRLEKKLNKVLKKLEQ